MRFDSTRSTYTSPIKTGRSLRSDNYNPMAQQVYRFQQLLIEWRGLVEIGHIPRTICGLLYERMRHVGSRTGLFEEGQPRKSRTPYTLSQHQYIMEPRKKHAPQVAFCLACLAVIDHKRVLYLHLNIKTIRRRECPSSKSWQSFCMCFSVFVFGTV